MYMSDTPLSVHKEPGFVWLLLLYREGEICVSDVSGIRRRLLMRVAITNHVAGMDALITRRAFAGYSNFQDAAEPTNANLRATKGENSREGFH